VKKRKGEQSTESRSTS